MSTSDLHDIAFLRGPIGHTLSDYDSEPEAPAYNIHDAIDALMKEESKEGVECCSENWSAMKRMTTAEHFAEIKERTTNERVEVCLDIEKIRDLRHDYEWAVAIRTELDNEQAERDIADIYRAWLRPHVEFHMRVQEILWDWNHKVRMSRKHEAPRIQVPRVYPDRVSYAKDRPPIVRGHKAQEALNKRRKEQKKRDEGKTALEEAEKMRAAEAWLRGLNKE